MHALGFSGKGRLGQGVTEIREAQELKEILKGELSRILERDPEVEDFVICLVRPYFARRQETESRFDRIL